MFGTTNYRPDAPGRSTRPALQIKLSPEVLQQLLNSGGKDIALDLDNHGLRIGKTTHKFSAVPESAAVNVCRYNDRRPADLTIAGKLEHRLTVQRQLGGSATELLRNRQAEERAAKENRSVQEIPVSALGRGRSIQKLAPISRSATPDKHLLPAAVTKVKQSGGASRRSPLLVASSPKLVTPLKTRVLQILATSSHSREDLRSKLRSTEPIETVLSEYASVRGDEVSLKDEAYALVKVWDWKSYTTAERTAVISRATEAYDRLKLPVDDARRQKLVHPDKRIQAGTPSEISDTSPLELGPSPAGSSISQRSDESQVQKTNVSAGVAVPGTRAANGLMSLGKQAAKRKATPKAMIEERPAKAIKLERQSQPASATSKAEGRPAPSQTRERTEGNASTHSSSSDASSEPVSRLIKLKVTSTTSKPTILRSSQDASPPKIRTTESAISLRTPSPRTLDEAQEKMLTNSHDRTSSMASTASVRSTTSTSTADTSASTHRAVPIVPTVQKKLAKKSHATDQAAPSLEASDAVTPRPAAEAANKKRKTPADDADRPSAAATSVSKDTNSETSKTPGKRKSEAQLPDVTRSTSLQSAKEALASHDQTELPQSDVAARDLEALARRYQQQYPEYKRLHEHVKAAAERGTGTQLESDLERLQRMHDELQGWRQTLFAAATNKRAVADVST